MSFTKNYNSGSNYTPKKPVKSFLDLEVYQRALEASVFVAKRVAPAVKRENTKTRKHRNTKTQKQEELGVDIPEMILRNMLPCALGIPHLIAEAHSYRFGIQQESLLLLEKVMLNCNKMVVYLEQVRDICETDIPWEDFDEQIKKYFYTRRKVLNLQRVWRKFMQIKIEEQRPAPEVARG